MSQSSGYVLVGTERAGAGKAATKMTQPWSSPHSDHLTSPAPDFSPLRMMMRTRISKLSPGSSTRDWNKTVKALGLLARRMLSNYHSPQYNPGMGPSHHFFICNHIHTHYIHTCVHTCVYMDVYTYTCTLCTQ